MHRLSHPFKSRAVFLVLIGLLIGSVIGGGIAIANTSSSTSSPTITACVLKLGGVLRIPTANLPCNPRLETITTWNQAGQQGVAGPSGPAGPAGAPGSSGAAGPAGAPGSSGAAGPAGAIGPSGASGALGPAGPAGPTGAAGPTGPVGPAGAQGPAGSAGSGISNFDALQGMACNVASPLQGTISVTYSAIGAVSIDCTPSTSYALNLTVDGGGAVSSNPAGISCSTTCSHSFLINKVVTLSAASTPGLAFTGWGGACTGTGTCTVTMSAARDITANFIPGGLLTVGVTVGFDSGCVFQCQIDSGEVDSSPAGITCGANGSNGTNSGPCSAQFPVGTQVTLTRIGGATTFTWSGACSGSAMTCVVTIVAQDLSVGASFR